MSRRSAFTLIELMISVLIIGILVGVLIPALGQARRSARATVGAANLRSLNGVMNAYLNDYREIYLTPFRDRDPSNSEGTRWFDAVAPNDPTLYWRFKNPDPQTGTDDFMYFWYSFLSVHDGKARHREEQISPDDAGLRTQADTLSDQWHNPDLLWPTSYAYSPTFWSDSSRYAGPWLSVTSRSLAANSQANVRSPAGKVVLFQRADFVNSRSGEGLVSWNSPKANTWVATVDGSCSQVRIRDLMAAAERDDAMLPVEFDRTGETLPVVQSRGPLVPEFDVEEAGFPSFFKSTRFGIAGRDLQR